MTKRFTGHKPARQDLGVYRDPKGKETPVELVVKAPQLGHMVKRAVKSPNGRAEAAGGGVVVQVVRGKAVAQLAEREDLHESLAQVVAFGLQRAEALEKGDAPAAAEALRQLDTAAARLRSHRKKADEDAHKAKSPNRSTAA